MKKYIKLLSIIAIISIAITGCKASNNNENTIDASTDSDKSKEKVDKDIIAISDEEFVEEIRTIVNTTVYPKESIDFFEKYYKSVDFDVASEGLTLIIESLENSQDAINNDFFNGKLDLLLYEAYNHKTKSIDSSKLDSSTLALYQNIILDNAYRIHSSEGMAYPILDYSYFKKYFNNLNDEFKDFITLLASESDEPMYNDGGFAISYEQMTTRILNTEDFIDKYPDSSFSETVISNMKNYTSAYMLGANNTPAFDYDTNILNSELKASFESFIDLYPKSKFAEYLKGYYDVLSKNNFKLVNDYYTSSAIEAIYKSQDK